THDTSEGTNAAIAAALMSHYFLYRLGKKAELGKFLASMVPGPWAGQWQGKVGPKSNDEWARCHYGRHVQQSHERPPEGLRCLDRRRGYGRGDRPGSRFMLRRNRAGSPRASLSES